MRLRAPSGVCGPISHRGRTLDLAGDQSIDLDEEDAQTLCAHGFRPLDELAQPTLENLPHEALLAEVLARTKTFAETLTTPDLRARLRSLAINAQPPLPPEDHAAGVLVEPAHGAPIEIDSMSRNELFAFLRARGAPAALPIRNEELRQRARTLLDPGAA